MAHVDIIDAGRRGYGEEVGVVVGATLNADDANGAGDSTRESWCLTPIHNAQATDSVCGVRVRYMLYINSVPRS